MPKTGEKRSPKQEKRDPRGRECAGIDQEVITSIGESTKELMIREMRESGSG